MIQCPPSSAPAGGCGTTAAAILWFWPCEIPLLGVDHNPVFDLDGAGRRPGDALRLLALGPRMHGALKDHLTTLRLDPNTVGVDPGVAAESFFDHALDPPWLSLRLQRDQVDDALDSPDMVNHTLRPLALELPFDLAFERDHPVRDGRPDMIGHERH